TFDKHGTTNSIGSDFLNNANSSNTSVKELHCNPYNIEISIDTDNFMAESEIALMIKYLFILAFLFFGIVYGRSSRGSRINHDYMLQLVNNARSDSGLSPLKIDSCLTKSAQSHSEYMNRIDTLTHDDDDNGDFPTRATDNGYDWEALAENIANEVRIRNNNTTGSEMARKRSNLEKRVSNKIISYVLVFILQWTPVQIFCAAKFFHIDSAWIYVVCVIGVHFGGLGNAIQYIVNEGWHPRNVDSNVSWSFAESPSHFLKRFYPNSRNMHVPSSMSSLPSSSRPPSSSTVSI
ncbi:9315_t:CDS:2, partial [Cetraspora pellucida]